ncbi:MAG: dihydrofolate reductase family protein [Chloroflexi bacterium]|nr:dihydrofolate reductase family protein [Chloroflexota bacterium]
MIADLKARTDKDIWIVGGGDLAAQAVQAGALDEIQLAIMPILLGRGTPLFAAFDGQLHRLSRHTPCFPTAC